MLISIKTKVKLLDYKSLWDSDDEYLNGCFLNKINFHVPLKNEGVDTDLYSDYLNLKHEKDINKSILNVDNQCVDDFFYSFLCIEANSLKKEINFLRIKIPSTKNDNISILTEILKAKNENFSVSEIVDNYFMVPRHDNFVVEIQLKRKSNEIGEKKQTIQMDYNKGLLKISISDFLGNDRIETPNKEIKVIMNSKDIFKSLPYIFEKFSDEALRDSSSCGSNSLLKKLSISV